MADIRRSSSYGNLAGAGKPSVLPPKTPLPAMSYSDYASTRCRESKGIPRSREGLKHHQRTCSEGFLVEEQPSWIDDLLDEPEAPVKRAAHRRSSSDSFMYLDAWSRSPDNSMLDGHKHSMPSWGSRELDYLGDGQCSAYYADSNSIGGFQNRGWESPWNKANPSNNHLSTKEKIIYPREHGLMSTEKQDMDQKGSSERRELLHGKNPQTDIDNKRVKQQFAQRSRVRKLQYIADLERAVQALQGEGLEVLAEVDFLNQQNLMLDLENKALNQRLDSLAQEHLVKCLQHEMWEREVVRLRALLFQQQQHQQQQHPPNSAHGRRNSRDLDSQFANLALNHHKEGNSGQDPFLNRCE